jgi:heat shock protein 1/8
MNTENTIIGIDLGTTFSCVGVWKEGKVEIIANNQGERTTPSWVAFNDSERLIGAPAKSQVTRNPKNTVFDSKRMLGKQFRDSTIQNDMKHWPFNVIKSSDGKPLIQVTYKGAVKEFRPEEISSMVLSRMKETAENYLGFDVKRAVVTVPAYFNDAQRRATKDAGAIAGLTVERIINEPTAAAMAYGLDKQSADERNVLIYDLGGGTLDISVLTIDNGLFEVRATSGNTYLGGQDFDNNMITWCLKEFKKQNKSVDVKELVTNKKVLGKLRSVCEKAKKTLSSNSSAAIEIDSLFDGIDFCTKITRAKFEALCDDIFTKCMEPVSKVLLDSKMAKADIHDIVLVGGSTRTPKIRELLSKFFNGADLKSDINPDEAVAYGAAIQGAVLAKVNDPKIDTICLIDVTPLSMGIETAGGLMTKVIPRNSTIPCCKEQTFSTYSDNQPGVTVKIYEGEREFTRNNNLLGNFELTNLPLMPRGIPKINVKFDVDANGIMNVTAVEESTGKTNHITIKNDTDRFTSSQLEEMIQEADKFKEDDLKLKEKLEARNDLENYIYNARNSANTEEFKATLSEDDGKKITELVTETIQWLEDNDDCTKEEYDEKRKSVEELLTPIFMASHNKNSQDIPVDPTHGPQEQVSETPIVEEVD